MRCHPEEEYEQPFGVLVADKLRGVRVAEVAEGHLEEGRPVQVLGNLQVLKPKSLWTKLCTYYRDRPKGGPKVA